MTLLTEFRNRSLVREVGCAVWLVRPRHHSIEDVNLSIVSAVALSIRVETGDSDDVKKIIKNHREFTLSVTPAEFSFSLDVEDLLDSDLLVVVLRENNEAVSIGALRRIEAGHFEIKSMHTLASARRKGYSRKVLEYLINLARESGAHRVSLETGSGPAFEAARVLYEKVGFVPCGPFGSYPDHDGNFFMTLRLEQ